jgi:DNA-binding NtrC family response regulator
MNREKGKGAGTTISQAALERICEHSWPGNVRELENLIERLVILRGEGEICVDDLPDTFRQGPAAARAGAPRIPAGGIAFNEVVDHFESDLILQALEQTHWNKNRAAQLLGLNRTTLIEKIKKKRLSADNP